MNIYLKKYIYMYLCNGGTKERATKRYIHKLFSRILGDTYCRAEKRINKSERKCLANFYVEENAKDDCEPFHSFSVLFKARVSKGARRFLFRTRVHDRLEEEWI